MVGWHQDADHANLGPVHLQVTQNDAPVEHESGTFIDEHPMAVVVARLDRLPDAFASVLWEDRTVTEID